MQSCHVTDFADWRRKARDFLSRSIPPQDIQWQGQDQSSYSLFSHDHAVQEKEHSFSVPSEFVSLAKTVACHADQAKWSVLYACLWRLVHGEPKLLRITSDPLVRRLELFSKAVKRDAHKTKAFVRFREYKNEDGTSHFIAWHDPDHDVLPLVAGFFQRRFAIMRWTIMTPFCTLHCDQGEIEFLPGVPAYAHSQSDDVEAIWQAYYRSTFNPARVKLKMMRQEMPVRYWKTLPETNLIPLMLQEAEQRVQDMMKLMPQSESDK